MPEEQKPEANAKDSSEQRPRPSGRPPPSRPGVQQAGQRPQEDKKFEGYLSEVVELAGRRTGIYGEIKQAMCKILEGKDKGRVIRRNIAGRIVVGDIIRLPDTSREDKPIRSR
jgi:small subunit ribosomal protein S28e